ncbi:hypothetical protein DXT63_17345 [Thermoanaerobacteraceae bacterium SP2]|nr:hypothetical protein DXT63_17345 [Thermoanaerobacteraceae bacterium SP2]
MAELGRPYPARETVKRKHISQYGEVAILEGGSLRGNSIDDCRETKHDIEKVPCFIQVYWPPIIWT